MFAWIAANIWTLVVSAVLAVIVYAIVRKLIRDKRQGRSSCGHGCANCAMHGQCHGKQ